MVQENNIFNKDFLAALNELSIGENELDGIYAYLSMFSDDISTEEKAFWAVLLEKFDPEYNEEIDEEDTDTES